MSKYYFEISDDDDAEMCRQKSKCNLNLLRDEARKVYDSYKYIDMSNGDKKRFKEWIIDLFLNESK